MATRKTAQQRPAPTKAPTRTTSSAAAKRTTTAAKRTTTPEKRTTTAEKRTTRRSQPVEGAASKTAAPDLTNSAATPAQPVPTVNSEESPTSRSTDNRPAGAPKPEKTLEQTLQKMLDGYAKDLKAIKRQVKASKAKLADLGKDVAKIKKDRQKVKAQRRR